MRYGIVYVFNIAPRIDPGGVFCCIEGGYQLLELDEFKTKNGREAADLHVEHALYKTAIGGNATAQIFYLTNRLSMQWHKNPEPKGEDPMAVIRQLVESNKRIAADVLSADGRADRRGDDDF